MTIIHNSLSVSIPLKYTRQSIKLAEGFYKDNDFDVFISKMKENPLTCKIIENPKYMFVFEKQAKKHSGLQPSKLLEINIVDSIAIFLGLNNYKICEIEKVQKEIKQHLLKNAKLVYYNDDFSILLVLYGDPYFTDAQYINNNTKENIEIKDIIARVLEADLLYDVDGKLYFSNKNQEKYGCYQPIINVFNENNDIFQQLGSNYSIGEEHIQILKTAFRQYIEDKKIAYFCFVVEKNKEEKLVLISSQNIENKVSFSGSEIRPTGKNHIKVWLPTLLEDKIALVSGIRTTVDGKKYIKISLKEENIVPMSKKSSAMKMGNFFRFPIKSTLIKEGYYYVPERAIKQIEANICVHIQLLPEHIP